MAEGKVAGIILAAGKASRFGEIKQLLAWSDKNLVNTIVETAFLAGLDPVVVVLGANAEAIRESLTDERLEVVVNRDYEDGQSTSLKAGMKALGDDVEGALFLLCDQPQLSVNLIRAVAEEGLRSEKAVTPIINDHRANPVYFPKSSFPLFEKLAGDSGGRQIISETPHTTLVWLDDWMAKDIDTPEDYQALREHFGLSEGKV